MSLFLTSTLTPRVLNEVRVSWQRLGNYHQCRPTRPRKTIPSIEIPELGLTGFNAAASRTAIGLAVNLPQFRYNNTYQLQDTVSWIERQSFGEIRHRLPDARRSRASSSRPSVAGLPYPTLQNFVNDIPPGSRHQHAASRAAKRSTITTGTTTTTSSRIPGE